MSAVDEGYFAFWLPGSGVRVLPSLKDVAQLGQSRFIFSCRPLPHFYNYTIYISVVKESYFALLMPVSGVRVPPSVIRCSSVGRAGKQSLFACYLIINNVDVLLHQRFFLFSYNYQIIPHSSIIYEFLFSQGFIMSLRTPIY